MKIIGGVERVDGRNLSYTDFWQKYMLKNQPVILTGLTDNWRACSDWVTDDETPNLSFFSQHFPTSTVQVTDCNKKEFTDQKRLEMTVAEYVDYWRGLNSCDKGHEAPLLYLKDWHFVKEYPEYVAYITPEFFKDDWLNLYLDNYHMHGSQRIDEDDKSDVSCSDYRFVYMGPKGTWTPLHADVFRSYSWSANICGKKIWHLLSPSQSEFLFDRHKKNTAYDIYGDISTEHFPHFSKTCWLECIQEKGEIIFVPSGWFHQVKNLEDTISINHNWFNACNVMWVWNLLVIDYNEAKEYIEDIRSIAEDFENLCQHNLAANTGMNFDDFFMFITRMALTHLTELFEVLNALKSNQIKGSLELGKLKPLIFNLFSVCRVADKMTCLDHFKFCRSDFKFSRKETGILLTEGKASMVQDACIAETSEAINMLFDDVAEAVISLSSPEKTLISDNDSNVLNEPKQYQSSCQYISVNYLLSNDFELAISNPRQLVQLIYDGIALVKKELKTSSHLDETLYQYC